MSNSHNKNLDESLYSRQLYVLGTDTMSKLMSSTVLLYGMDGLGQEIAKNIILAGINTLLIYDPSPVQPTDLCTGFYLRSEHIGCRKDSSVLSSLLQLNPYVTVQIYDPNESDTTDRCKNTDICTKLHTTPHPNLIVCANLPLNLSLHYNNISRTNNIPFISCQIHGLFSQIFTDFGPSFTTLDTTGEPLLTGPINDISQEGILTTADKLRHELEDQDVIKICDIPHLENIMFSVKVLSPYELQLELVGGEGSNNTNPYTHFNFGVVEGGIFEQVKVPKTLYFQPLSQSLLTPDILTLPHSTPERDLILHKCFLTLNTYISKGNPTINNTPLDNSTTSNTPLLYVDTNTFLRMYEDEYGNADKHEELIKLFCKQCCGTLMPMCSVIGGFVSQEVIKGCCNKYYPLHQFLYFECSMDGDMVEGVNDSGIELEGVSDKNSRLEGVSDNTTDNLHPLTNNTCKQHPFNTTTDTQHPPTPPINRYTPLLTLFGPKAFSVLENLKIFLIGAGAIGCEHLKNIVMCGMGVNGTISVTDMDSIETSNLNRQFLFKKKDVQRMKSEVAVEESLRMNSDYLGNRSDTKDTSNSNTSNTNTPTNRIVHYHLKVGKETESVFSDTFLTNTSIIVNALDNIEARLYVDKRCITNKVPLFESGTLGTKGNVQVIIPFKTESYGSSRDPPEKSIPLCTIRNFPHCIEHTIEWALSEFKSNFEERIKSIAEYVNEGGFVGDIKGSELEGVNNKDSEQHPVNHMDNLSTESVAIGEDIRVLVSNIPKSIYDCVRQGVLLFNRYFYNNIKTLIDTFPVGHVTAEGQPFWVPPKRPPVPFSFSKEDFLHVLFVQSYCRIMCSVYGLGGVSYEEVENMLSGVLDGGVNNDSNYHPVNDKSNQQHPVNDNDSNYHPVNNKSDQQHPVSTTINTLHPVILEKDNDGNGHIDFIYACANLRARNYKIKEVNKLTVKGIAGRIIPAIATTTSVISGLCVLEMIRYVLYGKGYKNWYVNLGLSFIGCTDVMEAEKMECSIVRVGGVNDKGSNLEGVSNSTYEQQGVDTNQSEQHVNTTTFTLWSSFVFGDCKLYEILEYFKRDWNVDISMVTIRDTVVFCTFYGNERFKNNLEKFISELCSKKEGDGVIYCSVECLFDVDGDNLPEVVVDFRRAKGEVLGLVG